MPPGDHGLNSLRTVAIGKGGESAGLKISMESREELAWCKTEQSCESFYHFGER